MFDQFLKRANELLASERPFAIAVVVRYQAPISGKPGNKAIISSEGAIWGWIGGGCAEPVVVREALRAIADGKPRLVRISPSSSPEEGIVDYTMTCHSGGTLDIYIEPVLPKPHILILGRSPVAVALAKLGKAINYSVSVAAPELDRENFPDADMLQADLDLRQMKITSETFIVVSTQGHQDEQAVENALRSEAGYVAFVASKTKASKVAEYLKEKGLPAPRVGQLRAPAGLDIRAGSPQEIAVSILAEIIAVNRSRKDTRKGEAARSPARQDAKDPVCGMAVEVSSNQHKSEWNGNAFYFCCAGCKQKFDTHPARYLLAAAEP